MKRPVLLLALLAATAAPVLAADQAPEKELSKALKLFAKTLPKTGIDSFKPSPISGLYQVGAGPQVFYFSPEGYLFFGEIWTADGKNLTAQAREEIIRDNFARLPLEKALTIGSGPVQVVEFTDPDCPFCRQLDQVLAGRKDITRHVFFFPLESIHPSARDKARFILCSADRERAMREVYTGGLDGQPIPETGDCQADALIDEYLRAGGSVGVRGTPTIWIDGKRVQADARTIATILDQKGGNQ
ncbi:thiol:disulfide interchange protein DsbC [Geothermobacter ehrlichii]|uniref:Thiol:disulfide interchange protein DsbC n=1 Tax=Geothermobacter ehrlichii TaxID=213224 RepID=A0A5D3WHJ5_9BACT|nr:DsbC family protein [Geothermobacter ehrlichii]TYO96796.1 thiol:disulfide interchange protein DsbC [Geothermobacter ehrlichii]